MSKLDELRRSAGGNVAESASRRYEPVIAPAVGALSPARMEGVARSKAALEIPLAKIERDPGQPREEFAPEALAQLAESIRARGLLQPVRVRWVEESGRYRLIAGERRWRAAEMAGLATLTCIVADDELSAAELLAVQVTENLLREDLNPLERARAFRTLMDLNGWSGNQLAKELGISQPSVVHALSLLELPAAVQERVESGELAPSVGYHLSKIDNPAEQTAIAERVVTEGLSREQVAETVRRATGDRMKGRGAGKGKARKVTERTFRTSVGPRVTVEFRRGLDSDLIREALQEILEQFGAEQGREEAA